MADAAFAGKWAFTSSTGSLITLTDANSGALGLAAAVSGGDTQWLNAYGDPSSNLILQAGNGLYLTYADSAYAATLSRDAAGESTFVLDGNDSDGYHIVEISSDGHFFLNADGADLVRVEATDSPPATALFQRNEITPDVAAIVERGALGDNLRYVFFGGQDLSRTSFLTSDLSLAVLSGATLTAATMDQTTLHHTDFSGADISTVSFSGATGDSANFEGVVLVRGSTSNPDHPALASLDGATLTKANFKGAKQVDSPGGFAVGPRFSSATLTDADFTNADLTGVTATGATLDGATFTAAKFCFGQLDGSSFKGMSMDQADFSNAQVQRCDFEGAQLVGANFAGAQITDSSFKQAILTNADLSTVLPDTGTIDITGATLIATNLNGLDLTKFVIDKDTIFIKAQMKKVLLTGHTLDSVDFFFADLDGANLDSTSLIKTNFASADLSNISALAGGQGVPFSAANLANAKLANAKLKGARFGAVDSTPAAVLSNTWMPNADLTSANLNAAEMSGVQWYGPNAKADANLQEASLTRANLSTMNLSQSRLSGVDLSFSNLVNTNLSGATLNPTQQGRAASLAFASLQGTNFTDAKLASANLTNAAVALSVTAAAEANNFVGVPLFTLPVALVATLDAGLVDADLKKDFVDAGYPLIDSVTIKEIVSGGQWSLDNWDTSVTAPLQAGYAGFMLMIAKDNSSIGVFGTSPLLAIAVDDKNQQIQQAPTFDATSGIDAAMDDQTTCPSGMRYGMLKRGIDYIELMTPALPPHPPSCIPSPTHWC